MKILLVGGGSGGSVSPLLAVAKSIKKQHPHAEFLFVGSRNGVEKQMAQADGLVYAAISAGKWRRYFSVANLAAPFLTLAGFLEAHKILSKFKPQVVFGAGSFVQVPMVWAAYFKSVPVVLHQQDIIPSLANKLCQAAASKITVTFEKSLTDFASQVGIFYKKPIEKVVLTGNPFRHQLADFTKTQGEKFFGLKNNLPTLLVLGGGTGAEGLNKIVISSLPELTKTIQVVHIAGRDKSVGNKMENYYPFDFTSHMGEAYAAADIVLSRCGLSTLTELSNLKKVSILVPMPGSHQEINARLINHLGAAVVVEQKQLRAELLVKIVKHILFDYELQKGLAANIFKIMPQHADEKIAKIILKLINDSKR